MQRAKGLTQEHYWTPANGLRQTCHGLYHYPDYCPYYDSNTVGDCLTMCCGLAAADRPCWMATHDIRWGKAPAPTTPSFKVTHDTHGHLGYKNVNKFDDIAICKNCMQMAHFKDTELQAAYKGKDPASVCEVDKGTGTVNCLKWLDNHMKCCEHPDYTYCNIKHLQFSNS